MVLLFGGTTEGRKAAEVLDQGDAIYYYSTKTGEQELTLHHGERIDGAMDDAAMAAFCHAHHIKLIIDAAHPFASELHQTVARVARQLSLPAIRYERIFPDRDPSLTWIDDYADIPRDIHSLLATTGVQSIGRLKALEQQGMRVVYRILRRASSVSLAHRQGATDNQLVFYDQESPLPASVASSFDAILMKESGESGGFAAKVAAARAYGLRVVVLKRPAMPDGFHCVNGPYGLRRMVERLLPAFYPLKSGLTTGTCATAAAVAATLRLLRGEMPAEVPVLLPNGETISVHVGFAGDYAYCIKDAGDDPDVTDGLEIRATVFRAEHGATVSHGFSRQSKENRMKPCKTEAINSEKACRTEAINNEKACRTEAEIAICGGEGVGRFTLPGFDYPPGEAAINKVPRQMIRQNLRAILSSRGTPFPSLRVTISVPYGEVVAQKTFNPRLGIEGGISIIGVSGIVMPYSEEAFLESIHKCMEVAKASGTRWVVINSGAKSERFVRSRYPFLPRQAFVEYGNYIGPTLLMAHELGFSAVTLGVMLGKAVKLAAGHLDTHSRRATMDKHFVSQMLREAGCPDDMSQITLARELWDVLSEPQRQAFARVVVSHCEEHCRPLLPKSSLTILLIDDEGRIYG